MKDLKEKTIRGGLARMAAQAANFLLRLGSLMVLARLLEPKDFGLVGMVTAFTGVLTLFRDFGLSAAAVQHKDVTEDQISTLFWINILVGVILGLVSLALAPAIVAFYHEPRLFGVTAVLAIGFLLNAAGVQHSSLLTREMRFTALAVISTVSLVFGTAVAVGGAMAGYGYWALVAMSIINPLIYTMGVWLTTAWIPGMPHRRSGIRSMMRFGGTITLNGLVVYIASNFEKVLLGRFWGANTLGIYGRAYQLVNIPTDNVNSSVGEVAFSALSRLQDDPSRLRSYFLKGYSVVLAMTLPITMACAIFADDMISVFLGPKWHAAAAIFRLLAPTILVFAIANPLAWLVMSLGLVKRSLKMGLVIAPLMIASYVIGLPYGPKGVAFAYSTVMVLWVVPVIVWSVHDTVISIRDIAVTAGRPLLSAIVAAAVGFGMQFLLGRSMSPLTRLILGLLFLFGTHVVMLFYVMGQKAVYLNLLRAVQKRASVAEEIPVSA
jgi:O-antigen/teichoic acid export membrane protein